MSITIRSVSGRALYVAESAQDVRAAAVAAVENHTNLYDADLRDANLRDANLYDADLRDANLYGADLRGADLRGANLRDAKNAELAAATTNICPEGDLIGWKKCRNGRIVKLRIPGAAKRSNATGRKCRAEYAVVLKVMDGAGASATVAYSQHDATFAYRVGETVRPDAFDENRWNECSTGIHYFITREEAASW